MTNRLMLKLLPLGAALTIFAFALASWSFLKLEQRTDENHRALVALCAFQADLEQRVERRKKFLQDHPQGANGSSAQDIQLVIDAQQRTIDVIKPQLRCPP